MNLHLPIPIGVANKIYPLIYNVFYCQTRLQPSYKKLGYIKIFCHPNAQHFPIESLWNGIKIENLCPLLDFQESIEKLSLRYIASYTVTIKPVSSPPIGEKLNINNKFIIKRTFRGMLLSFTIFSVAVDSYAEQHLAETIVKIKPGIVAVGTYMPKRNPRAVFLATGFAVGDGSLIVTNAHVIPNKLDHEHLEEVAVFYHKDDTDKAIIAKEVALDKEHDLAILKISGSQLTPLNLGSVSSVREGQLYAFTGFPIGMVLGLHPVTHRGIVSAITPNVIPMLRSEQINQKLLKRLQDPYNVFQLDATAYPGNSGSPLYDPDTGKVIGVINKVFVQESKENVLTKPSGISYAIPVNYVENLLKAQGLH